MSGSRASWTAFGAGKVILLGEHAVVYGHPAVAAPLSVGVRALGRPAKTCGLVLPKGLGALQRQALAAAFERAAGACGRPPVQVRLESELPRSQGLGSSAAVSVACARLLLEVGAGGKPPLLGRVEEVAHEMECVFHGTPSGVDHTTSVRGQLIRFVKGPLVAKPRVRPLRSPTPLWLVLVLAGDRGSTKESVGSLRARTGKWPERYRRLLADIGKVADEGAKAIEAGDLEALGDVMNVNHGLLHALGLSSGRLDSVVHALREAGALGAKLSGAGGKGGVVIGLFREPRGVVARLERGGLSAFATQVAGPGVE